MKRPACSHASSRSDLALVALLVCLSAGCGRETSAPAEYEVRIRTATPTVRGVPSVRIEAAGAEAVELFAASTRIGSDTIEPFIVLWDTNRFPNGPIVLQATAHWRNTVRSAETTVEVANPARTPGLFLHPAVARLQLGQSMTFVGVVHDVPNPSVRWEVAGGHERGTVDAEGRYTAPSVLPPDPAVLLRATSRWDPKRVSEAVIHLEPPPVPIEVAHRCRSAFFVPAAADASAEAAVVEAAGWIVAATSLRGARTTTGTLEEEASGSRSYRYSPLPTDRMIVRLVGMDGPLEYQLRDVELIAETVSEETLARSHEKFHFDLLRFDGTRATIDSSSRLQVGRDGTERIDFARACVTTQRIGSEPIGCTFRSNGREIRVVRPQTIRRTITRRIDGELSGAWGSGVCALRISSAETVDRSTGETDREESSEFETELNSDQGRLRWADVTLFSHTRKGRVATPERWLARGELTIGDRTAGRLDHLSAPLEGARSPEYVVALLDGGRLPL